MAGKKIKGRKRHIVVDTHGHLLGVTVHAANLHDTASGIFPVQYAATLYPSVKRLCGDSGYRGTFVAEVEEWNGLPVDIVERKKRSIMACASKKMDCGTNFCMVERLTAVKQRL